MKTSPSRFGTITISSTNEQIENCWLRLDSDKPYLEVPRNSFVSENWEIITGSFNGLDHVTFYNCYTSGGNSGRGGSYRKIFFSFMFENHTFSTKEDLLFNKVTIDSTALDKWILTDYNLTYLQENEPDSLLLIPKRKVIHKSSTKYGDIYIIQGFNVSISDNNATFNRRTIIEFDFDNDLHFDEINKLLVRIRRLILFLTHESPQIERYTFQIGKGRTVYMKDRSRFNHISGLSEGIDLDYSIIAPQLAIILKNWIENEELVQVIELIQEKYMNTTLSFQNYFLNCCVALESFHLRVVKKNVSIEVMNQIRSRVDKREVIINLIEDEELKKEFEDKTVDWKKSTFKEKLIHFHYEIKSIKNVTFDISIEDFISNIVKTRNKIAHEGDYLKYLTELELLLYGKVMEFVVKIKIIKVLGIEEDTLLQNLRTDASNRIRILAERNGYNK